MKTTILFSLLAALALAAGCGGKKPSTARQLVDAFPSNSVALEAAETGETSAAAGDATLAQDTASRRVYAGETARAIQNHDYIGAMSRLQTLQRQANLSVPQRIAVQEAMESVQTKLVLEGAKGDARARQAAEEIRRNVQHQ
jgi:hypothetical protein